MWMLFRRKKETVKAEWLIVGLGNPGGEYRGTRHNVGFEVVDRLAEKHRIKLGRAKHRAQTGTGRIGGVEVVLAKPLTYMNLSGNSVAPLARELDLPPERILVVADDLDLPLGKVKLKPKGSHGGHNGHRSLIASLRSQEYPRIKVGIGKASGETVEHVLSAFDRDERDLADEMIAKAAEGVESVVQQGLEKGMNLVNEGPPRVSIKHPENREGEESE